MTQERPANLRQIGRPMPRPATRRLLAGRGSYLDDVTWPRQLHAAFLRSPHAHADIEAIELTAAGQLPGVTAVLTWTDLAPVCAPWQTASRAFPGLLSPTQYPLAHGRVAYQGEPVALVLAATRAVAEDALEAIAIDYRERPAVTELGRALAPGAPLTHPELGTNLAWSVGLGTGDVDAAFASAALTVEERLTFTRSTGVTLEPRGLLAAYDAASGRLQVRISHQMPHQIALHLAELLSLPMNRVEVTAPDVGGAFGIKMHVYPEEIAVCAAAKLLARPVKFVADRIESMVSDVHVREHEVRARMAVDADGRITAFDVDDLHGIGAYSVYPRSSTVETVMALRAVGAPYSFGALRARAQVALQNKGVTGQYRSVGHPIACAVTERLVDLAARRLGLDPLAFRRLNYLAPEAMPCVNPAGLRLLDLSHAACLDALVSLLDLDLLRQTIARERSEGRVLGLGFAAFVEMTATGSEGYGAAGVPVAATDTIVLSLEPDGSLRAGASVSEIGQGITQGLAQIIAEAVGVAPEAVALSTGETRHVPHGGGAWASRGAAIGGEAAFEAGRRLRAEVLRVAASLLQARADGLDIREGVVVDETGAPRVALDELAGLVAFRGHELPAGTAPQLTIAHSYRREGDPAIPTNGIQASLVEIDPGTGLVQPRRHWVVADCGRIINPLLVDEQIRGGVVQGIGEALLEACLYDDGQMVTATLADYRLPVADGVPDIVVGHIETPYSGSVLGAKGAGEAGTCAAGAAVLNAVNDALSPFAGSVHELPITPPAVLRALGRLPKEAG
jgi:aerobic carbon-monoxide dehydrogenase large subunit